MSYNTLAQQAADAALAARVQAATVKEAVNNPELADSAFGREVILTPSRSTVLMYPVSVATEAEYASALAAGNPNPGGDEAVITDAMILSAVQAHWPPDPA